jgi:hypothetical protein
LPNTAYFSVQNKKFFLTLGKTWAPRTATQGKAFLSRTWVEVMRKSTYAIAAALIAAATVSLLSLFSPAVQARAPEAALAEAVAVKGDRLDAPLLGTDCSQREWPYFENACLRNASNRGVVVRQPRMISVDRLSARDTSGVVAER